MPPTKAGLRTASLQFLLLIVSVGLFLYLTAYAKQLVPSSEPAEVFVILVAGEILLLEVLYFRSFYRRRVTMTVTEETISLGAPHRARYRPSYNHYILFSVFTFILFILVLAYIVSLPTLTGQVIYNVVSILVTIQGLLLGLLGVSAIPFASKLGRLKALVALTISSILISVAAIMIGEVSAPVPQDVLAAFFLVSVTGFSIVVGIYSWLILEARAASTSDKGLSKTKPE
jgi:hypothetical protein